MTKSARLSFCLDNNICTDAIVILYNKKVKSGAAEAQKVEQVVLLSEGL